LRSPPEAVLLYPLAGALQFLAQYPSQRFLEGFVRPSHVLAQRSIDQGLVVAASCRLDLRLEPLDDIVVESDRPSI